MRKLSSPTYQSSSTTTSTSSSAASSSRACCSKQLGLRKGPWTLKEDATLAEYIGREGEGRWQTLPKRAGLLRCGKSCRLRWMNYLRPSVKRGHVAPDEEDLIIRLHRLLGNRWSLIAGKIPGRTDNEIKNYWNTHLSKRLISQGIDPRTHKPIDPNNKPNSSSSNALVPSLNSALKSSPDPKQKENKEIRYENSTYHKDGTADHDVHVDYYDGGAWILEEEEQVDNEVWSRKPEGLNIVGFNYNGRRTDLDYDDHLFSSFLNSLANDSAGTPIQ